MPLQPSEVAEAIMLTFRMNPNAFVEEITLQVRTEAVLATKAHFAVQFPHGEVSYPMNAFVAVKF